MGHVSKTTPFLDGDDKSPLKGAWFCSHDPVLYAQLIITPSTVDASAAVH